MGKGGDEGKRGKEKRGGKGIERGDEN